MSCGTLDPGRSFRISRTGFLPSLIPLPNGFCYPTRCLRQSTTPIDRSPSVWPLPLSLAATQGIDVSFSSSGYLDVSVHRVASCKAMDSLYGAYTLLYAGCPIRTSAGHRLFAPYRSFSQLATSFFGSYCQGIHLMLFVS